VVAILSKSKILSACRPSYGKYRLWQVESNAIKFDSSSDPQSPPSRNVSFDRFFGDGVIYVAWATNSDVRLLAGAALLVAGAMVFFFAMKSILKYSRRR
jgi:hypothetical protein